MSDIQALEKAANEARKTIIRASFKKKSQHIASCLSPVDAMTTLYFHAMKVDSENPADPERDRFLLSKGHGALGLYAVLAERGFFSKEMLIQNFAAEGTTIPTHPSINCLPGVEICSGSLGHALSIGNGMALAGKIDNRNYRVFVLLSDGECDEGSNWEAALSIAHNQLDNLIVLVDYNKLQGYGRTNEVVNLEPFEDKWRAFGFAVNKINGHEIKNLVEVLDSLPLETGKPTAIIMDTVNGKGVSFMEDTNDWHYFTLNNETFEKAMKELNSR